MYTIAISIKFDNAGKSMI